ncbi:MAG: hypothetical protein SGJ16_13900 [Nitrospirota bacterium]|nr:hypothetical protein [Nitrospirota bacterium]
MDRLPQVRINDPQLRGLDGDPLALRSASAFLCAPPHDFFELVPDDLSTIEGPMEHFSHGTGRPTTRTLANGGDPFIIQPFRYASNTESTGIHLKNLAHHRGFCFVDYAQHMEPFTFRILDFVILIAIGFPTRDMTIFGFSLHRVVSPLLSLLAFELPAE